MEAIITPPYSDVPTPPLSDEKSSSECSAVDALLQLCRDCQSGVQQSSTWKKLDIDPVQYSEFERVALADDRLWGFLRHKLRFDYDAYRSEVVVRMPSDLHETFTQGITCLIQDQLRQIRGQGGIIGDWAQNIVPVGSSDVRLSLTDIRPDRSKRSPDTSFAHRDARYPGLVVEVAYSQKAKDLPRLADDYILGSNGNIMMVLGLDLEYKGSSSARAFVWKPQYIVDPETSQQDLSTQLVYANTFTTPAGHLGPESSITINIEDFAPEALLPDSDPALGQQTLITITSMQLYQELDSARRRVAGSAAGVEKILDPSTRKRKMSSSPVEELSGLDESVVRDQEASAVRRASDEDADYQPSSRRARGSATRSRRYR